MEAKKCNAGSHAWTSILHGRNVLLQGCRWRIGNGQSVSIWNTFWLPRNNAPQVLSPIIDSMADAKVEILIDETTRQWNHAVIDGIFTTEEAELIKAIPLPRQEAEDGWFWPFTKDGVYNSKSGYRFLKSEVEAEINEEQVERDRTLWRGLWSLQVPNKIKHMIWKACQNSLPTKQNLVRRTIIDDPICDRCKLEPETAIHALWSCTELDVVWEDDSLWNCRRTNNFIDFKELLSWLISNQHHIELFSVIACTVWTQRNQVRLRKPCSGPHLLSALAKDRLAEFVAVQPATPLPRIAASSSRAQWSCPAQDLVKINCDGAIFASQKKSGVGVVIRDSDGAVLCSLSKQLHQAYSPFQVEAMAASTALQLASDLGFRRAVLESDSQSLVNALTKESSILSSDGLLVDVRFFAKFFNQLHYSHVRREGNMVAHNLARYALRISSFVVWMEDVPPPLFPIVLANTAGFS